MSDYKRMLIDRFLTMFGLLLVALFVLSLVFGIANAGMVTLQWSANTEPDLDGYKIYYGTESGEYQEPISIDADLVEYSMHIPDNVKYYFVATAFDTEGLESDYSNEVDCMNNDKPIIIQLHIICNN